MYAELSSSAKEDDPHATVEHFLNIQEILDRNTLITNTLLQTTSSSPDCNVETTTSDRRREAASWINAALSTDLSPFTVYSNKSTQSNKLTIVLDGPKSASSKPRSSPSARAPSLTQAREWERGGGLEEEAELARALKDDARGWFLGFIEKFLDANVAMKGPVDREKVAGMLAQLKSVNDWLDEIERNEGEGDGEEASSDMMPAGKIGRLRKKIYEYLLAHVESAAVALGGGGSSRDHR